jgi:AMP-polyphosphate phosphotransferase
MTDKTASRLASLDLNQSLTKSSYIQKLERYQTAMRLLAYRAYEAKRPVLLVYEGWDAAGKGGNIKRVTEKLDPRGYTVHSIAAPSGEDATHHYLWRFWRRLPEAGQVAVFDRSWYGRVLVERVEGFCTEGEWRQAYGEINDFERQLADFGALIFKFWIHISPEEQLNRFRSRQQDQFKSWKLTDEDWRNRDKWDPYAEAIEDMLRLTDTSYAPWDLIAGNDKRFARISALKILVKRLALELDYDPFAALPVAAGKATAAKKNDKR